jgi:hypothetical protein
LDYGSCGKAILIVLCTSILLSIMDIPIDIPRKSVEGFPFLYTLLKKV